MNLYWAVYDGNTDPTTAQQIIDGVWAGSGNVFTGNDVAPTEDTVGFQGAPITGLTPSTTYKLAGVWSDGAGNDSNIDITLPFDTQPVAVTDITPLTAAIQVVTPDVDVALDITVAPVTAVLQVVTPDVDVFAGVTLDITPTTAQIQVVTPDVEVQFLQFTNVTVLTAEIQVVTPDVEIVKFQDVFVDPTTVSIQVVTPLVDINVGVDLNVDPLTATIEVATPAQSITTPVEFLTATEAAPLEYVVSVGGDVQMTSNPDATGVRAWRNEHGGLVELDPFPSVIVSQPANSNVTAPAPASFTITAEGALSYQWYVDDVPQIGETLASLTIDPTTPGSYKVRCMVINSSGIGITSKDANLTVAA